MVLIEQWNSYCFLYTRACCFIVVVFCYFLFDVFVVFNLPGFTYGNVKYPFFLTDHDT